MSAWASTGIYMERSHQFRYDEHHTTMRYSAEHKARSHAKLLKKASEQFRGEGVQGIGIAKLMGQIGLTHGGFYAHFENKNDLVIAALAKMFDEISTYVRAAVESAADGNYVSAIVNAYLSEDHRDHPKRGCPVAALSSEIARQPPPVRQGYTRGFDGLVKTMAKYLTGANEEERCQRARLLLAGMAGNMMIARAASDRDLSNTILAQAREFYICAFGGVPKKKG